jgi:hypothetical protein
MVSIPEFHDYLSCGLGGQHASAVAAAGDTITYDVDGPSFEWEEVPASEAEGSRLCLGIGIFSVFAGWCVCDVF